MTRRTGVRAFTTAVGMAAVLGLAACGGDDEPAATTAASGGGGDGGGEKIEVAHFTAYLGSPFDQASLEASKEHAGAMNAAVTNFDAGNDPQKQLQQCQDAIATQKFKAFIVKPVDGAAAAPCARQAIEAGISVVALNTPIGPDAEKVEPQVDGLAGSVVTLPSTYGQALAEMTVKACEGQSPCKVAYVFGPPAFSFIANARKVFNDEIAKHDSIEIVAEDSSEFSPDKAASITKQLLQKHPDLNAITSDDDASSIAIAKTLADAGKAEQIALSSGGGAAEAVELVKSGEIFGTAVLAPRSETRRALEIVVQTARGEQVEGATATNAAELISVGTFVTKENAAEFTPEWKTSG